MKVGWKPTPVISSQTWTAYHQALPGRTGPRSVVQD